MATFQIVVGKRVRSAARCCSCRRAQAVRAGSDGHWYCDECAKLAVQAGWAVIGPVRMMPLPDHQRRCEGR